jgi:hypothetical protein
MDNFSGHKLAVQLVGGLQGLLNVRIVWLPPNTTSHWQLMDQGIIASFKLQYRKQWVKYMIQQLNADKDPNKTVTLLKAIQWSRVAWEQMVTPSTIQKCWWKSTCIKKPAEEEEIKDNQEAERAELQEQLALLSTPNKGEERLSIDDFINPTDETIVDDDINIFALVVEHHTADKEGEEEIDEEDIEVAKVSTVEALKALEVVKL